MTPLAPGSTALRLAFVILSASGPWMTALRAQSPLITEFLAVNDRGLTDEDGDHSDWVEIHNPGIVSIALNGWSLTDQPDDLAKWRFPAVEVPGGGFLDVFASGKHRVPATPRGTAPGATLDGRSLDGAAPELHTNFKLQAAGEYLALVAPNGRIAHAYAPAYPAQRADVSYGVAPDGGRTYLTPPTPGKKNGTAGIAGLVADTKFSVDRGFYDDPVFVEITTETPGAEIRFTLDGTEPTASSGEIYSTPILVDRTTTLRAAAFRPDLRPTGVDTHTYLFLADVVRQDHQRTLEAGFPASWGETPPDYGMDPDVIGPDGSDRYGGRYAATIEDDLKAVPTLSIAMDIDDLFGPDGIYTHSMERGVEWERPASVELIYPDGRPGFEVRCGIRIQGGAFRNHLVTRKHSLRLLFKGIYGPTKLRFPWFGEGATDSFDTITLRAGSNDGWQWEGADSRPLYIRDSFARATLLAMGQVAPHGSFAHVYINGIYWGLYNAVERPGASFSATYHGGDKDDWDAISGGVVSSGSLDAWNTMVEMASAGLEDDAAYQRIQGRSPDGTDDPALESYLDVRGFADYMITTLYVGNTDWPRKNYWVARNRRGGEAARPDAGGFKFYAWDTEWSIGIRSSLNTDGIAVTEGVAVAWPYLRENEEFRVLFGDHVHRHFFGGGALYVDPSRPEWDPENPELNVPAARFMRLCDLVDRAVVPESARWGDQHVSPAYTRDEHWQQERDNLLTNYFPYRSAVALAQLRSSGLYPRIEAPELNRHGGTFTSSFAVLMTVPAGRIFYTLDGGDPRLPGGAISPLAIEIPARERTHPLHPGAEMRFLVPRDGSLGLDWTRLDFDDSSWPQGRTGVGYERSSGYEDLILTDVEETLYGQGSSVYLRIPFVLDDVDDKLPVLSMKYDDGFVAYLNGRRIVVANAPTFPRWDSLAITLRSDSLGRRFQEFDLGEYAGLLRSGRNLLAIHGMNHTTTSADLILLPQLELIEPLVPKGPVLNTTTVVKARAWVDGQWSALAEAAFVDASLRITEIMYHPPDPPLGPAGAGPHAPDDYEFIEIENTGGSAVDLAGARLAGAIAYDFSAGEISSLAPGEFLLVVKKLAAFASLYATSGLLIAGEYGGNLSNAGETLRLEGPHGTTILDFAYADDWHPETDGAGHSLVIVDPRAEPAAWGESSNWTASAFPGGSPGAPEGGAPAFVGWQLIGDANQDGRLDVSDVVTLLRRLFRSGPSVALPCESAPPDGGGNVTVLDWNGDRIVDLSDAASLLSAFFSIGPDVARRVDCVQIEGCATVCAP